MSNIDIIIPAYEEYENLQLLLPRIITVLDTAGLDYRVMLMDRVTSTDKTPELQLLHPKVCVFNRYPTDSYGDAVRHGIRQSEAEYMLFMDADGSHDPEFILRLLEQKKNGEIIIASRYVEGGGSHNGPVLKFMSMLVNLSYRVILQIPAKDVSNSFKLYKSDILKPLLLKCNNFDIIEEILYKTLKVNKKIRIVEIPYFFKERIHGNTKRDLISFSFSFLYTLIRLRLS
ncbi:MAG: glycosyltransferase [Chitinophagaceae bacterium]